MSVELPFLDAPSYKWIFVGGKGGVGKTTTACSIAITLTRTRRRVLLVSTDPASNIGDTFQQHFSSEPMAVDGFERLWAMEYSSQFEGGTAEMQSAMNLPGVDELQALSSLFDSIDKDDFDIVVFDTAPTGHTMRLLQLPSSCQSVFGSLGLFGGAIGNLLSSFMGGAMADQGPRAQDFQRLLLNADKRLKDPMECTFVCVLLPEFLPLYETERLIEFLNEKEFETHVLVVNQVILERKPNNCRFCQKRFAMQQQYLHDVHEMFDDFRIVEVPVLENEVKGEVAIRQFADLLSPLFSH
jgi:arsenite-transporting ATPase